MFSLKLVKRKKLSMPVKQNYLLNYAVDVFRCSKTTERKLCFFETVKIN